MIYINKLLDIVQTLDIGKFNLDFSDFFRIFLIFLFTFNFQIILDNVGYRFHSVFALSL